ncbi:putative vmac [Fasciola gigantica]|uniref:Putative vmac n=1 Tax=Fasciola gigantica TaxID=46835 RepID=A0A504YBZ5_FASGI|nr:putative vmac [Fasciola gigantica]
MMWFGSGQPKTQIQEANRHLSALTERVAELEEQLRIKEEELKKKEDDFVIAMQETQERRELELRDLNNLIYQQNLKLQRLESDLSKRDSELIVLRKRGRMLDEILRYKATLGKLTITMEQAEQFARLTSGARNYNQIDNTTDNVNTEPAPLMIRDVSFADEQHQFVNGEEPVDGVNTRGIALADTRPGPKLIQLSQRNCSPR